MSEKAFDTSKDQKGSFAHFFEGPPLEIREEVKRFLKKYLGTDGVFLLHLIGQHADVVFTTELIAALWKKHLDFEQQRKCAKSSPHALSCRALKQMNRVLPLLTGEKFESEIVPTTSTPSKGSKGGSGATTTDSSPMKHAVTEQGPLRDLYGPSKYRKASAPGSPSTRRKTSQAGASPSGHRRLSITRVGRFQSRKMQPSITSMGLKRTLSETEVEEIHAPFEDSDEDESLPAHSKQSTPARKPTKDQGTSESMRRRSRWE